MLEFALSAICREVVSEYAFEDCTKGEGRGFTVIADTLESLPETAGKGGPVVFTTAETSNGKQESPGTVTVSYSREGSGSAFYVETDSSHAGAGGADGKGKDSFGFSGDLDGNLSPAASRVIVDPAAGGESRLNHMEAACFTPSRPAPGKGEAEGTVTKNNHGPRGRYASGGTAPSDDLPANPAGEGICPENAAFFPETGSDGMIRPRGMEPGDYILAEIKPPAGCPALTDPVYSTLGNNGTDAAVVLDKEDVGVENVPGEELPVTGGNGCGAFAAAGLTLTAGATAAPGVVNRKRKGKNHDKL